MKKFKHVCLLAAASIAGVAGWTVAQGVFTKPAHAVTTFTNASMKGTYGFTLKGNFGSNPISGYGVLSADGSGGVTGTQNLQLPTGPLTRSFQGTYTVNADGTGSLLLQFPDLTTTDVDGGNTGTPPPFHFSFVLVDGSKQIRSIQTDPGTSITSDFQLQ